MANTEKLTTYLVIKTPEKSFYEGPVEEVILETPTGQIGILPNHVSMAAAVTPGAMGFKVDGKWRWAFLSEGFADIDATKVAILADTATCPEDIDTDRAKMAEQRALERLQGKLSHQDYIRSRAALQRALARLRVSNMKGG